MEVTPVFNEAATETTGPHDLGGGGSVAEEPPAHEADDANGSRTPGRSTSEAFEQAAEGADEVTPPPLSIEDAEAELEQLKSELEQPAFDQDYDPPPKLAQIVKTGVDRQTRARIFALEAYLEHVRPDPNHSARHDEDESLEPTL